MRKMLMESCCLRIRRRCADTMGPGARRGLATALAALALAAAPAAPASEEPVAAPPGEVEQALMGAEAYFHFAMAKLAQSQQRFDAAVAFLQEAAEADPASASIQAELARTYLTIRDYPAAEESARRALELESGHPEAHTVLAQLYYSRARRGIEPEANRRRAMAELEASLTGGADDNPEVLLTLGRFYFEEGDYAKAAEVLGRYAEEQPSPSPNALFLLARARVQSEDYEGAELILQQVLEQVPDSLQALETLVNLRRLRGDYAGSLPLLQRILAVQGGDANLYRRLGEAHFQVGDYSAALEMFDMARREEPGSLFTLYYLALSQERLGRLPEALATLEEMNDRDSANTEVVFRMAQLHERLGNGERAVELYRQLVDMLEDVEDPEDPRRGDIGTFCSRAAVLLLEMTRYNEAARELSDCRGRVGSPAPVLDLLMVRALVFARKDEKALHEARQARLAHPDDSRFPVLEAEVLLHLDREEEARAELERILAADEGDEAEETRALVADAWFNAGAQADRRGDTGRAETFLQQALAVDPQHGPALNYLGYTWADGDRRLEEALDLLLRAVALDPDNGAYQDSLGWAYFRLGRLGEARTHLRRAAELEPGDATIREHLGDLEAAAGQRREALELWREALDLGPDDAADAEALRRKIRESEQDQPAP